LGLLLFILPPPEPLHAWLVNYKEDYYSLYHVHYAAAPDDILENIWYLEKAVKANFCNPAYALATITTDTQWAKYQDLFMMHLYIKLVDQHIALGNKWNKTHAYFYEEPWKAEYLDDLNTAETCYKTAQIYWNDALEWAKKANDKQYRWINLDKDARFWQDEAGEITTGELDYGATLKRTLAKLENIRSQYQAMDENTYKTLGQR
jgi:hypothetical protein